MNEKHRRSWERVRANGQLRYSLFYGGVIWGTSFGVLQLVLRFIFILVRNHFTLTFLNGNFIAFSAFSIIFFYFAGCILGSLMWNRYETNYLKSINRAE
jgi:hypothetical protein